MTWESSILYYKLVNQETKKRLGGHHNARSVMVTVDFAPLAQMQHDEDWDGAGSAAVEAARQVERGGADFLVICSNTMHKAADRIEAALKIPLLHIADATAEAIGRAGERRVGLLGTRFTMEQPFLRSRVEKHGIEVMVPDVDGREVVHRIIYDELAHGVARPESRARYQEVIAGLVLRGAESVILGCTEIGLLIGAGDVPVPVHDTTAIHAMAAVDWALA